jgi:hypothetical protein
VTCTARYSLGAWVQFPDAALHKVWSFFFQSNIFGTDFFFASQTDTLVQFLWQDDLVYVADFITDCFKLFVNSCRFIRIRPRLLEHI